MENGGRDKGHQSVLNVDRDVLNTIVNEKNIFSTDIIHISSGDEVDDSESDDNESSPAQPSANTTEVCMILPARSIDGRAYYLLTIVIITADDRRRLHAIASRSNNQSRSIIQSRSSPTRKDY